MTRAMSLRLESPAFEDGAPLPVRFTADGAAVSPPLRWSGTPEGTRSLALVCEDLDAPYGTWTHWVLYDLSTSTTALPEAVPPIGLLDGGAKQGMNDWKRLGWGAPSPPAGPPHRYVFRLLALKWTSGLRPGATRRELLAEIHEDVLEDARLVGTHARS